MARIRSTFPGQWTDEDFVTCSPLARLLALALRNEADDQGIFEWKPTGLKMRLLPADLVDVGGLLAELMENRQVMRFEVGGKAFGAIRNFMRYQRPKKPRPVHPTTPQVLEWVGKDAPSKQAGSEQQADGEDESSEPVLNQSATGTEITAQREEGGGRREEVPTTLHSVQGGGSAASAATTTGTDGLILAFDDALAAAWGDGARRKQPHATDAETAQAWAAAGVTPETAARVCAEQFAQMRDRGARVPWSLAAVTSDVLAAAAAPPAAEPITNRESPERAQWRKRLEGHARNEPWLTSWGAHPGDTACEAPPDLIAEVLPHLANTAQIVRMPSGRSKGK